MVSIKVSSFKNIIKNMRLLFASTKSRAYRLFKVMLNVKSVSRKSHLIITQFVHGATLEDDIKNSFGLSYDLDAYPVMIHTTKEENFQALQVLSC